MFNFRDNKQPLKRNKHPVCRFIWINTKDLFLSSIKITLGIILLVTLFAIVFQYKQQLEINNRELENMVRLIEEEKLLLYEKTRRDMNFTVNLVLQDIKTNIENKLLKDFPDKDDLLKQFNENEFNPAVIAAIYDGIDDSAYFVKLKGFNPKIIVGTPKGIIAEIDGSTSKRELIGNHPIIPWDIKASMICYSEKTKELFDHIIENNFFMGDIIPNDYCLEDSELKNSKMSISDIFKTEFLRHSIMLKRFDLFRVKYIYESSDIFGNRDHLNENNEMVFSHKVIIILTFNMFEYLDTNAPEILNMLMIDEYFQHNKNPFNNKAVYILLALFLFTGIILYAVIVTDQYKEGNNRRRSFNERVIETIEDAMRDDNRNIASNNDDGDVETKI